MAATGFSVAVALRLIGNHLRWQLAHLNLGTHLLDLRRLLFQLRYKSMHLVLEIADNGFLVRSIRFKLVTWS